MWWLRSIRRLLNNRWLFFANLILAAISAFVVTVRHGRSDLLVRAWGVALELVGMLTVWAGLTGRARKLGRRDIGPFIISTLKAFFRRNTTNQVAGTTPTAPGPAERARRRADVPQRHPTDRTRTPEFNADEVNRGELAGQRADEVTDALNFKMEAEARAYDRTICGLRSSMDDLATENLSVLLSGVIWLAAGTILVILAPEIVKTAVREWPAIWRGW